MLVPKGYVLSMLLNAHISGILKENKLWVPINYTRCLKCVLVFRVGMLHTTNNQHRCFSEIHCTDNVCYY